MNWYRALALVVLAVVVPACAGGSAGSTARVVHTHGTIVRVGGPAPGSPVPIAGARLEIRGRGGSTDVRTDRHGRFAFDLPSGTYRVTATGHTLLGNGSLQPFPRVIHIRPHARPLHLYVNIK